MASNFHKALITILGEEADHPIFQENGAQGVNDNVRRVDVDIEYVVTTSEGITITNADINQSIGYDGQHNAEAYHMFHSCGHVLKPRLVNNGIINRLLRVFKKGDRIIPVNFLQCSPCKKTLEFTEEYGGTPVFHPIRFVDVVWHLDYSLHVNPIYRAEDPNFEKIRTLPPNFVDRLYNENRQRDYNNNLESLLERLFPNVPASVMEMLISRVVEQVDKTISTLEDILSIETFERSHSDAVGKFSIGTPEHPQRYIIKVFKNKAIAQKEILVAQAASVVLPLALYVPRMFVEQPLSYKGYHLIVMEDVAKQSIPYDLYKRKALQYVGSKRKGLSDRLVHRLYVANLFHTALVGIGDNELLCRSGVSLYRRYYSARELQERLGSFLGQKTASTIALGSFDNAVAYICDTINDTRTIVHNDMREPNWVSGHIIDFANSSRADKSGGIYRDIVRILLADKDPQIFDEAYVHHVIDCYYAFRDFEEHRDTVSKSPRDMEKEYIRTIAELYVEAPRHILINCKLLPKEQWQEEIERYQAIAQFAEKQLIKRMRPFH